MTLEGYVDGFGDREGGGTRSPVVFLSPWRELDRGGARADRLRIELPPAAEAQLRDGTVRRGAPVEVTVSELAPPKSGIWCWEARATTPVRPATPGAALVELRRRLGSPVVVTDLVLGRLTLDRELDEYRGRCRRRGLECPIVVSRSSGADDRAADRRDVATAREAVLRLEGRVPELLAAAAGELAPVWNRHWRDGDAELDAHALAARLSLSSIEIDPSRHTLMLDAGELFGEHQIELRLSPHGDVQEVGLAG